MAVSSPSPSYFLPIWLLTFFALPIVLGVTTVSLSAELLSTAEALASNPRAGDVDRVIQTTKEHSPQIDLLSGSVSRFRRTTSSSKACEISKLLFPAKYVDVSSSSYTAEVQKPW